MEGRKPQQALRRPQERGRLWRGRNAEAEPAKRKVSRGREVWRMRHQSPQKKKIGHFSKTKRKALKRKLTSQWRDDRHTSRRRRTQNSNLES